MLASSLHHQHRRRKRSGRGSPLPPVIMEEQEEGQEDHGIADCDDSNCSFDRVPGRAITSVSSSNSSGICSTNSQDQHDTAPVKETPSNDESPPTPSTSFSFDDISRIPRELVEQVDWISHCQHPLEYLQMLGFHRQQKHTQQTEDTDYEITLDLDDPDTDNNSVNGTTYKTFRLPKHCEYCGSPSITDCSSINCQRPQTFFSKERPPFL